MTTSGGLARTRPMTPHTGTSVVSNHGRKGLERVPFPAMTALALAGRRNFFQRSNP